LCGTWWRNACNAEIADQGRNATQKGGNEGNGFKIGHLSQMLICGILWIVLATKEIVQLRLQSEAGFSFSNLTPNCSPVSCQGDKLFAQSEAGSLHLWHGTQAIRQFNMDGVQLRSR
jgi:hypothetical protein